MAVEIHEIDTRTASEAELLELHELYHSVDSEYLPDDPPEPFERRRLDWQTITSDEDAPRWVLREDSEAVGAAVAWVNLEQNLDNGFARVHVVPEARGKGYARQLAESALTYLENQGRKRVDTHAKLGAPSEGFAERLGLKKVLQDRRSRLKLEDLDIGLMDEWMDKARERASDYELLFLKAPYPDELVQKYCDLHAVMNTAPRDDYEMEDWVLTPKMWREMEEAVDARATDLSTYIAVHAPSGDFAGYTTIQTDRLRPDQAWQWDTGVDPAHRNKGLGRWLKAALIKRVIEDYPEVERVDTWNAGSNEPMLAINVAMGFKGILETGTWQGDLATAIESL